MPPLINAPLYRPKIKLMALMLTRMITVKSNLIDSDGNMYLMADSLIEINKIITGSNNITLRKVNVEPYGFYKIYMNKDLIEDRLHAVIDQFKITSTKFYSVISNEIVHFLMEMVERVRPSLLMMIK